MRPIAPFADLANLKNQFAMNKKHFLSDPIGKIRHTPMREDLDMQPLLIRNTAEMCNNLVTLSPHFTLAELTASHAARQHGIDNLPTAEALENLRLLAQQMLEPLREAWGAPIVVTSGYRCPALNALVGGAAGSQHVLGRAVDIVAGWQRDDDRARLRPIEANRELFALAVRRVSFDQLIWERGGRWLHLSFVGKNENRNQVLASNDRGGYRGIAHCWRQVVCGGAQTKRKGVQQ